MAVFTWLAPVFCSALAAADLGSRALAALRQLPNLRCYDGRTTAVLAGPGRFHRCVESQQIGLTSDLLNDVDLLRDLFHRRDSLRYSVAAGLGVHRGL